MNGVKEISIEPENQYILGNGGLHVEKIYLFLYAKEKPKTLLGRFGGFPLHNMHFYGHTKCRTFPHVCLE